MELSFIRRGFFILLIVLLWAHTVLCGAVVSSVWRPCPVDCTQDFNLGGYNVSLNKLTGIWPAVYYHSDDTNSISNIPTFFNISVCSRLLSSGSCHNDHVCYTTDYKSFYSLAAHGTCQYKVENRILTLSYNYSSGAVSQFSRGNLTITLVCGRSLGVPEVIEGDPTTKSIDILWITSSVCKPTVTQRNETKCYLVNHSFNNGIKASFIDLSGLIQSSGYEATSSERPDLMFNVSVCHPINTGGQCDNAMICLYRNDSQLAIPNGLTLPGPIAIFSQSESAAPHYEGSDVVVTYPITVPGISSSDCGHSPYAKIRFLCPTGDQDLGVTIEFIDPKLCQINFLWITTHACDITSVVSPTCTLTTPFGIGFDLTNLAETRVTPPGSVYEYDIKPCASTGLSEPCGRTGVSDVIRSTQTNSVTGTCSVIGKGKGKLRYIDNGLSLTYTLGDTCHNGIARTTIITFLCPSDVNTNCTSDNCLTFVAEEHCVYQFEWVTNIACSHVTGSKCKFQLNGATYDFGLLTEDTTPTYAAVLTDDSTTVCYLINPCGILEVTNSTYTSAQYCNKRLAPSLCANSSVCQIKVSGSPVPMGLFNLQNTNTLFTIDHSVLSVSSLPSSNNKSIIIQYICQTGALLTTPVYISQYTDDIVEFHWYTSAACPQTLAMGSECTVTETRTGYQFNLTSLSSHTLHYNDTTSNNHYMISVCSPLPSTLYPSGSACGNHSGICQQLKSHNFSAGRHNSQLTYDNSVLKLVYEGGDECSDHSRRKTTLVFLCDITATDTIVQNVSEVRHCEYLVEIKTILACPPAFRSKECVYFSPDGHSYDLLELAKSQGNWQAEGSDGSVYLINVCRPLNLQGLGHCNPLSSVCRINNNTKGQVLGYSSSSNLHRDNSSNADLKADLILTYTFTQTSSDGVQCPLITTDIYLFCNHSISVGNGPRHVSGGDSSNACHFKFHWITRVACPLVNETSKSCNVTDTTSGYTFNFEPLKAHSSVYTINDTAAETQYFISVCGPLAKDDSDCDESGIAGCQVDNHHNSHSTGTYASMVLAYNEGESITLTYTGGRSCSIGSRQTEIDFVCERSVGLGYPVGVRESQHCHYLFTWPTSLACLPTTLECVAGGGAYDLSPLMATNWRVDISGGQSLTLSVCQPVTGSVCTGGAGACTDSGLILGYVTGDLVIVSEGMIQLSYHNGAPCGNGRRKVTVINFHCNKKAGTGSPVLISSVNDCHVVFNWDTVYACSQDDSVSSNWTITNPVTGQVYNLTQLTPVLSTVSNGYNFTVGLAGHHVPCSGNNVNVSICQSSLKTTGGSFIIARTTPFTMTVTEGKVQVTYENGDMCHHVPRRRKAVIYFEYDHRPDYLEVLPEEECEYSLVVYTRLVHEKNYQVGIDCTLPNYPDLKWFTNQLVPPVSVDGNSKLYFSVCSPISSDNQLSATGYGPCDEMSGACLVNGSTVLNLGRPSKYHPPQLASDGNGVVITYSGGDSCGNVPYTTKIMLSCSNTSSGDVPSLVYPPLGTDLSTSCEFIIMWPSRHACPLSIPSTNISSTVCSLTDPYDGTNFDLSILSNRTHVMDTTNKYIMGLCGAIRDAPQACSQAGVCYRVGDQWLPMADSNHRITLISRTPHTLDVVYPSGPTCTNSNNWLTIIRLYCSKHHSTDRPSFVSDSNCELRFDWPTSALCVSDTEVCNAYNSDGTFYDLERLVSKTWQGKYYNSKGTLGVFNISMCRNLNPTADEGVHCFPGPTGICLQPDVSKPNSYMSLGSIYGVPIVGTDNIVVQYTGGDTCGSNNTINTTVNLHCSHESVDSPLLTKIDSCHYRIDWNSQDACIDKPVESNTSCVLEDIQSGIQYNFNSLAKPLTFNDGFGSYNICLCPGYKCPNPSLINVTNSSKTDLGHFTQMVVYPDGPQVIFQHGQTCTGGSHVSSTVFMKCDRSEEVEKGRLVWEKDLSVLDCKRFFSWWTPLACPTSEVVCTAHPPTSTQFYFDFTPLHPTDGYWKVNDDSDGTEYLINICGPIHGDENTGCGGNAAVCMKKSDGTYQDLGYVSTQSITFSNGNPVIHFHGPKLSTTARPFSVTIELICGLHSIQYHHDSNDPSTMYRFDWYTTFACPDTTNVHTQRDCSNYKETDNAYTFYPSKIGHHIVTKGSYTFHVNMCGKAQGCTGSHTSVCRTGGGGRELTLGTSTAPLILIDSYRMQVNLEGKDGNTTIIVECVGGGVVPKGSYQLDQLIVDNSYSTSSGVNVFFKLYTQNGCLFNEKGVPNVSPPSAQPGIPTTSTHKSNKGVIVALVVLVLILCIVILLIVVILWNKERRQHVMQKLFGTKSNEPVRYIRTKTSDTLLDDGSSDESEEDEEMIHETSMDGRGTLLVDIHDTTDNNNNKGKLSDEELLDL